MQLILNTAFWVVLVLAFVAAGTLLGLRLHRRWGKSDELPPEPPILPPSTPDPRKDPAMAMRLGVLDIEDLVDDADADIERKRKAVGLSDSATRKS